MYIIYMYIRTALHSTKEEYCTVVQKRPTFFGPDSGLGKSVSIWYMKSRSETKTTTFNIVRSAIGKLRKIQRGQCNKLLDP